jgi:hypothetical protein
MSNNLTFVTSFINIYETDFLHRTHEWRIQHFLQLVSSGIQIFIFVSRDYEELIREKTQNAANLHIKAIDWKDMWMYKEVFSENRDWTLPIHRTVAKDTAEYILLMNAKTEFMYEAIQENPWNSTHFAWIDFNIAYIFKKKIETQEYLKTLSSRQLAPEFLTISGCWDKMASTDFGIFLNCIHWRFCGGFFMGDRKSILHFYDLYREFFPTFLKEHKKLVWEVNFWAWLEFSQNWKPVWFKGDHNDSIFHTSADLFTKPMTPYATRHVYEYPHVWDFIPTSASYLYYKGQHLLNTRFVNYWIYDNGCYLIKNPDRIIENKNLFTILNDELQPGKFIEMKETIDLPNIEKPYSRGLEDIRLYESNGKVRFIATTVNYSVKGRNQMILGDYDIEGYDYKNYQLVQPPNGDGWIEKNWIPLIRHNAVTNMDEEYFVYKWSPMEIGKINPVTNNLEIVRSFQIQSPLFERLRGSSPFMKTADGLLGVVHFSEEHHPRHYYHMMVLLDSESFRPLKCSETFYFQRVGIEFCVGFTILGNDYVFWISQHDRDACYVKIGMDHIPLQYNILVNS